MSDLLGAAGVLLTVVGILFGMWHSDFQQLLNTPIDTFYRNNNKLRISVRSTLWSKAVPLAACSALSCLVFIPETATVIVDAVRRFWSDPTAAIGSYSAVRTAFCLVCLMTGGIAYLSVNVVIQLWQRLSSIEKTVKS